MSISDSTINVLLVDDDKIDTLTIQYGFREYNVQNTLVTAKNGVEALDLLYGRNNVDKLTSPPKIIIIDINMPKMNGFDFLRKLYSDPVYKSIPAIIITTSEANRDTQAAEDLQVVGYFLKPLNFAEFFPFYKNIIENEIAADTSIKPTQKTAAETQKKKILIVDDDDVDRMAIKKILKGKDFLAYEFIEANSASKGLEISQNEKIDCILLDYLLPEMTGLDFLKKIKINGRANQPAIMLTGAGDESIAVLAMKEGASDYLIKDSLTPQLLFKTMMHAIQKSQTELNLLETNKSLELTLTQLARVQNQLIQSEKMASAAQISAGIAHEINNPLGYVVINLEIFQKRVAILQKLFNLQKTLSYLCKDIPDKDIQKVNLQIAELEESERLTKITSDLPALIMEAKDGLLRIKKIINELMIFSPRYEGTRSLVNINQCVESAISSLADVMSNKIILHKAFSDLPEYMGYEIKLKSVFFNILKNAIQSITESGEISITTEANHSYIIVTVKDNGVGISEQDLDKIFTPFYTSREIGAGVGLGLSNAYSIIKMHSGEIKVASTPGNGSTFCIYLPINP